MKIVFMTNKHPHAGVLLRHIKQAGIELDTIILEDTQAGSYWKQIKGYQKKIGWVDTFKVVSKLAYTRYVKYGHLIKPEFYEAYARQVVSVPHFNKEECENLLTQLAPDIIVLGGARIIKDHILEKANVCVLNAHPGLLPQYRGVDVTAWAIHNGDPIGATVHVVDPGVDTGDIIERKELPLTPGAGLDQLNDELTELCGELMARAIQRIVEAGQVEAMPQERADGKQYYRMPQDLARQIDQQLKKGQLQT